MTAGQFGTGTFDPVILQLWAEGITRLDPDKTGRALQEGLSTDAPFDANDMDRPLLSVIRRLECLSADSMLSTNFNSANGLKERAHTIIAQMLDAGIDYSRQDILGRNITDMAFTLAGPGNADIVADIVMHNICGTIRKNEDVYDINFEPVFVAVGEPDLPYNIDRMDTMETINLVHETVRQNLEQDSPGISRTLNRLADGSPEKLALWRQVFCAPSLEQLPTPSRRYANASSYFNALIKDVIRMENTRHTRTYPHAIAVVRDELQRAHEDLKIAGHEMAQDLRQG